MSVRMTEENHASTPCLLYLISPPIIDDISHFVQLCEAAFEAAPEYIGAFQLRLKQPGTDIDRLTQRAASDDTVQRAAAALQPLCQRYDVTFILNDDPSLAVRLGADGVHLGQEDGAIAQARAIIGEEMILGATCHASRDLAFRAGEEGADYVAFGAFYPTTSKSDKAQRHWGAPSPDILQWWVDIAELPCVAIGGITPGNCRPLVQAGADFLAVISSIWQCPDGPAAAIRAFRQEIDISLQHRTPR